jgi:tetratricopeptide (TPR) repeat protein
VRSRGTLVRHVPRIRVTHIGSTLALALAALSFAPGAAAQTAASSAPTVRRPQLEPGADTNSANAYFMYGRKHLQSEPRDAADAYYWAIRLAPMWPLPYYGRAAALIIQNPNETLRRLRNGNESDDIGLATADTLRNAASLLDPFTLSSTFDWQVLDALLSQASHGEMWLTQGRRTGDPVWDAWMYESLGQVGNASKQYATAIRQLPKNYWLHAARGAVLVQAGELDSAVTEYRAYLEAARKRDTTKLVRFFRPQAYAEYALGELQLRRGDTAAARTAFEQAATEDLSFHMAHVRLGELAAARGDTAAAISEFETAVQLKDAADVHVRYGEALFAMQRVDKALKEFEAATRCEPYFALPYFAIARIYDAASYPDEALHHYKLFLERASPRVDEYAYAKQRIAALDSVRTAGASQ